MTGLAFVFLAVLLAAVFTREPVREAPITPNLLEQQEAVNQVAAAGPEPVKRSEPLAELGVAPGNAESNMVAPEAPAQ